jgi:hypothetical protein
VSPQLQRLPRRHDDVRLYDEELRSYLLVPDRGVAHELNPTARAVWELCDGTTTVNELIDAIRQVFSVEREVALADVTAVVEQLEAAGLVAWTEAPEQSN